jgi:hypothetical protein
LIFTAPSRRRKFGAWVCQFGNANPNPRVFDMQKLERASDQECLRLMLAFFRIEDPAQRLRLIALAEWFAADSSVRPCESTAPIMQDNHKQIRRRT